MHDTSSAPTAQAQPAPLPCKDLGNFTMVHNIVFRQWMAALSGEAFKALCCIIDRTWGYQVQEATISLTDFKRYMGLPSKHDPVVYRALKELFFFNLIAEGQTGLRGKRGYFVTDTITTNPPLVVEDGKLHATTNRGLVDLLTVRQWIYLHGVSSSPNQGLVDEKRSPASQPAPQATPRETKQEAKYTSLNTSFKDKDKYSELSELSSPKEMIVPDSSRGGDVEKREKGTKGRRDDFKGKEGNEDEGAPSVPQQSADNSIAYRQSSSNAHRRKTEQTTMEETKSAPIPLETRASEQKASERQELAEAVTQAAYEPDISLEVLQAQLAGEQTFLREQIGKQDALQRKVMDVTYGHGDLGAAKREAQANLTAQIESTREIERLRALIKRKEHPHLTMVG